jgi:photosystem II stability/assembly factor-like uncharacterized protein
VFSARSSPTHFARNFSRAVVFLSGLLAHPALGQRWDPSQFSEMRWRCIGPFRGGRTVAIAGVARQPNLFYMAAVNGGVWRSSDYGQGWTPIFDGQPTGSVGAIAVAASNPSVIYIGSGEGLQRPDLSVGDGIYKTTDGGQSWRHLGLRDGQQIAAILIDPRDANRVFAAVLGHPYGPNSERGVFRSLDGGETWERILYRDENTGAVDLAFEPGNPQTVFAALWAARVAPWEVRSGQSIEAPGGGLFKSTDGGNNWRQLSRGLLKAEEWGRVGLAIAPSRPNRIYLLAESRKEFNGLYRSDDGGESWERVNAERPVTGRGPGANGIAVAPDNPDVVYVANRSTYRSVDGGRSFTAIKGAPGGDDYQRIWINPEHPEIIALSSDQGATISVNGGRSWSSWYNQPTAQLYHVITDNRFPYWVYGSQQESGSVAIPSRSDFGEISFRDWRPAGIEEYGYVAPDPLDWRILYGGRITRGDQSLSESQDISPEPVRLGKYRYVRSEPVVFSPRDPHTLYFATNVLFKTTDGGQTWKTISPDLARQDYAVPENLGIFRDLDPEKGKHRGVIYALAPSFQDIKIIWAGTDDGLIHLTRDGGKHWSNITPADLTPWSKVSVIEASHFDANMAFAAINRFRLDDLKPYLYRTRDAGKTWQKITAGLPDSAPINVVREDPVRKGLLFVGTERSLYVSFDEGDSWSSLQLNLPHTSMRDLTIHGDDLIVGTHGRSFWILDDITPLRQLSAEESPLYFYRPQPAYRVRWNRNTDTPLPPEESAGKNPPDGAILNYYLRSTTTSAVTLEIFNAQNKPVRHFSSTDRPEPLIKEMNVPTYWVRPTPLLSGKAGMHRFVWDLHYPPPASIEPDYPISAIYRDTPRFPRGPSALPGKYTVKLIIGEDTRTQPLTVILDPRLKSTPKELARKFQLETNIARAMDQDFAALSEVKSLHEAVKKALLRAGSEKISDAIAPLEGDIAALEGETEDFFSPPTTGKRKQDFSRLSQNLQHLLQLVDGSDLAPTRAMEASFRELRRALELLLVRWQQLRGRDLQLLNQALRKNGFPAIEGSSPSRSDAASSSK